MSIRSSCFAATTLAMFAPLTLARAQTQPAAFIGVTSEDDYVQKEWRVWPATLPPPGQFRHCLAVRLTGHSVADAVVLVDQTPVLAVAPAIHSTVCYLPLCEPSAGEATNDLAVLQGGGDSPSRDALALVGPAGLRILHRAAVDGTFQLTVAQDGPWQSAQLVAAHPVDKDTIFGVSATGTEILVATRSGGGWSTSTFPIDDPALAIEAVRWDADEIAEVAVLTGSGVSIRHRDGRIASGGQFGGLPIAPPARSLARVRHGDGECVAWLAADPEGGADLVVCGASAGGDAWDLDGVDFVALAAGDWTLDGRDELFLTRRNGAETTMLVNAYPLAPCVFVRWFGFRMPHAQRLAQHTAPVAVGDFDGDFDGDLFTAGLGAGAFGQSEFMRSKVHLPPQLDLHVDYGAAAGSVVVTLSNYVPAVTGSGPAVLPVVASHVQIVVWQYQPGQTLQSGSMAASPLGRWLVEIPNPQNPVETPMAFTINLPPAAVADPGAFALLLRPVKVEGNDMVAAGSTHTGLLLTNQETADRLLGPFDGTPVPDVIIPLPLPPPPHPAIPGI